MKRLLLLTLIVFLISISSVYATSVMYISEASCWSIQTNCDCYQSEGYIQDHAFCQKLKSFNYEIIAINEDIIIANNPNTVDQIYNLADIIFLGETSSSAQSASFCTPIGSKLIPDQKFLFSTLANNEDVGCIISRLDFAVPVSQGGSYFSDQNYFKKIVSGTEEVTEFLKIDALDTIDEDFYENITDLSVRVIDESNGGYVGLITPSFIQPVLQIGLGDNKAVFWGFENPTNYTDTTWQLFKNTLKKILGEFVEYDINGTLTTDKNTYKPGEKINITFEEGEEEPDNINIWIIRTDLVEIYSDLLKDQGDFWNTSKPYIIASGIPTGGTYVINATAYKGSSMKSFTKSIKIVPYTIETYTDDSSYSAGEAVELKIDVKNSYIPKPNITANITIKNPDSSIAQHFYSNIAHNTYNISYNIPSDAMGGKYTFRIKLNDSSSREYLFENDFTVKTSGDIEVTPSEWNIATTSASEHDKTFFINNTGKTTISSLKISKSGTMDITFDKTTISNIGINKVVNFTATADIDTEGNYSSQIILTSDAIDYNIDVEAEYSEEPITDGLYISPASFSLVTVSDQVITKEFEIKNIASDFATLTYEIDDELKDFVTIKEKPSTLSADGTDNMKIEIDTGGLSEDVYSGSITVKSSIGDNSININVDIIGDLTEDANLKLTEILELKSRLDKLKNKDDYDTLVLDFNDIQLALEDAKSEYEDENYETAKSYYQNALTDISRLKTSISSLEDEKSNYSGIIWIVAILIIIAIIGVVVWKYKDELMKFINKILKKEPKQEQLQQEYYPQAEGDYRTEYY